MRWLVLGGAGYVGSSLISHILAAHPANEVTCIDSLRYDNAQAMAGFWGDRRFNFVEGDIRDKVLMQRALRTPDVVVNLAALVGAPVCDQNPEEAQSTNSDAVRQSVSLLSKDQRAVYLCTNSGYGQTDGVSEVDESSPLNPVSLYGRTKLEGEKATLAHPSSLSLRLATVFGVSPRMRFDLMVNDWTYQLTQKKAWAELKNPPFPTPKFKVFEPHFSRNYVHVRDVCGAVLHLVRREYVGVFNVGDPDANSTKWELAQRICRVIGLPEDYLKVDKESKDLDCRNYRVSNQKLLGTGFRFRNSLEDGIREVGEYVKVMPCMGNAEWRNA